MDVEERELTGMETEPLDEAYVANLTHTITVMAHHLAVARAELGHLKEQVAALKEQYEATPAYQAYSHFKETLKTEGDKESQLADDLRYAIVAWYELTGRAAKRANKWLSIRMERGVDYDPQEAREWCLKNNLDLLVLDAKRYEKGMLSGQLGSTAPGSVWEAPKGLIKTDLSELEDFDASSGGTEGQQPG